MRCGSIENWVLLDGEWRFKGAGLTVLFNFNSDGTWTAEENSSYLKGQAAGTWALISGGFVGSVDQSTILGLRKGHRWNDSIKTLSSHEMIVINEYGNEEVFLKVQ